jgi:ParB/RepB/Spo0J family partition protein
MITTAKLKELKPSADNVREYQSTEIDALKQSIQTVGLLQSLLVKPNGKGYEVIAGGRRLAALKALKYANDIPIQIVDEDADLAEVSLSENIYRQGLSQSEIRAALNKMAGDQPLTVKRAKEIAKRLHFSADEIRKAVAMARVHPEVAEYCGDNDRLLAAFAKTDDHELQYNVFQTLAEDNEYGIYPQDVTRALGFDGYRTQTMLDLVTRKAYTKAGGKVEANLFDDQIKVSDPALLEKLYGEALFVEDQKCADTLKDVADIKAITEEEAGSEVWERDYSRSANYPEDFSKGIQYGIWNGSIYCEANQPEPEAETETNDQGGTDEGSKLNLSQRAIDTLSPMRQAQIRRTIIDDADNPALQGLCCAFALARAYNAGWGNTAITGVTPDPHGSVSYKWATEPDLTTAWNDFYNLDTETQAKQIADIWTALFPPSLEETFASKFAGRRTQKPIELDEDHFDIYNKRDQLKAIAEEMGLELKKNAKLKDIRTALYEHNKANDWAWTPPELRLP